MGLSYETAKRVWDRVCNHTNGDSISDFFEWYDVDADDYYETCKLIDNAIESLKGENEARRKEETKEFLLDAPEGYDYYYEHHKVTDPDTGKEVFSAYNLAECPEDAIIGRDLFDAYDWLRAVEYGMELASQGYADVVLREVENG